MVAAFFQRLLDHLPNEEPSSTTSTMTRSESTKSSTRNIGMADGLPIRCDLT
jgi:hypothetical protein